MFETSKSFTRCQRLCGCGIGQYFLQPTDTCASQQHSMDRDHISHRSRSGEASNSSTPYNVNTPPLATRRHSASSSPPQTASNTCQISSRRVGHVLCTSARPSLYSTIHAMFTRIEQYCVVPLLSSDKTSKIYRTSNRPHEKAIVAAKTRHQS